jgi:hypothetical protein
LSAVCAAAGIAVKAAGSTSSIAVARRVRTNPDPNFFSIADMTI